MAATGILDILLIRVIMQILYSKLVSPQVKTGLEGQIPEFSLPQLPKITIPNIDTTYLIATEGSGKWILGTAAIVGIAIFFVLIRIATKMVTKIAIVLLAIGIGAALTTQQSSILDCLETCSCEVLGQNVEVWEALCNEQ